MRRRLKHRTVTAQCSECGSVASLDITPVAYVQHIWGRDLADTHAIKCVCGATLEVGIGEIARAA